MLNRSIVELAEDTTGDDDAGVFTGVVGIRVFLLLLSNCIGVAGDVVVIIST